MKLLQKAAITSLLILSSTLHADEIKDAINTATKHYNAGELSQAIAQLDYAATLLRQQKGELVKAAFPAAPSGWQAQDARSEVTAAAMFGGGISASRNYYNDNHSIDIELMMDSPMLQAFTMMLSNPSMIAMSGGRLIKVQGLSAVQKLDGSSLEVQFVTPAGAMVTVRGDSANQSTILALANGIDLKKL